MMNAQTVVIKSNFHFQYGMCQVRKLVNPSYAYEQWFASLPVGARVGIVK